MKNTLIIFVLTLALGSAFSQSNEAEYASFYLEFYEPSEETAPFAEVLYESGIIEEAVADLEATFILPQPISIVFGSGIPGPQYYQGVINMPYEFLLQNANVLAMSEFSDDAEEIIDIVLDLTEFVLYHEIGHAIVDVMDIPVLGKEEDAVDGFAAILSSVWDLDDVALAAAVVFAAGTVLEDGTEIPQSAFWDSHSLSEQRMYSLFCLIYGSDPEEHYDLLQESGMPEEKSGQCQYEYQETLRNWTRMFGEYTHPEFPGHTKFGPSTSSYGPGGGRYSSPSGWKASNK